jgi:hypothetical protein
LFVNTNAKTPQTFKKRAPLSSTSFPRLVTKIGATTSSTKSLPSSSKIKSSSSSSSDPPNNKNAAKKEIKFSSHTIEKLICGIKDKETSPTN